jgi:hypothetical protein
VSEGQNNYGRVAGPAQQGEGYEAYNVAGPSSAEGKLSSRDAFSYREALRTLASTPNMGKRGKIKKVKDKLFEHHRAIGTIENLRQKAAARAFDDINKTNMQFSKPWLRKVPQGLLTEEVAEDSLYNNSALMGDGRSFVPLSTRKERGEAMAGQRTFGAVGSGPLVGGSYQQSPVDMGEPALTARVRKSYSQGLSAYFNHRRGVLGGAGG